MLPFAQGRGAIEPRASLVAGRDVNSLAKRYGLWWKVTPYRPKGPGISGFDPRGQVEHDRRLNSETGAQYKTFAERFDCRLYPLGGGQPCKVPGSDGSVMSFSGDSPEKTFRVDSIVVPFR